MKKLLILVIFLLLLPVCASAAEDTTIYCIGQELNVPAEEVSTWVSKGWTTNKNDVILKPRMYMTEITRQDKDFNVLYVLKNETGKDIISYTVDFCLVNPKHNPLLDESGKEVAYKQTYYRMVHRNDNKVDEGDLMRIYRTIPFSKGAVGVCIRSITIQFENYEEITMWDGVILEEGALTFPHMINYGTVTLYDKYGKTIEVPYTETDSYLSQGWYKEPMKELRNLEGDSIIVPASQVAQYEKKGYVEFMPTTVYRADGSSSVVSIYELGLLLLEENYLEPVKKVYSRDGYYKNVPAEDVQKWISGGWGLTSQSATVNYADYVNGIDVIIDGREVAFDVLPRAINGRTMVPMRAIFEALGARVNWDGATQSIIGEKGTTKIVMQLGNNTMLKNGQPVALDVAPVAIDGRTLVPVRAIGEALGVNVEWKNDIQTVYITNSTYEPVRTFIFDLHGNLLDTDARIYDRYKARGFSVYREDVKTRMYSPDGSECVIFKGEFDNYHRQGWYSEPVIRLYNINNEECVVTKAVQAQYTSSGWYTEPVSILYSLDGRTTIAPKTKVQAMLRSGWYTEPSMTFYSPDGRTVVAPKSQYDLMIKSGWYDYPVIILYNAAGESRVFPRSDLNTLKKSGWQETRPSSSVSKPSTPGQGTTGTHKIPKYDLETCGHCNGNGHTSCHNCAGKGTITKTKVVKKTCSKCGGNGKTSSRVKCNECGGSGKVSDNEKVTQNCTICEGNKNSLCKYCGGKGTK